MASLCSLTVDCFMAWLMGRVAEQGRGETLWWFTQDLSTAKTCWILIRFVLMGCGCLPSCWPLCKVFESNSQNFQQFNWASKFAVLDGIKGGNTLFIVYSARTVVCVGLNNSHRIWVANSHTTSWYIINNLAHEFIINVWAYARLGIPSDTTKTKASQRRRKNRKTQTISRITRMNHQNYQSCSSDGNLANSG